MATVFPLVITNANVNTSTDTITSLGHGMSNGQPIYVTLENPGSLPAPLASDVTYYVISAATDTFQLSLTSGGSAIDLTTQGSGNFSLFASSVPVSPGSSTPTIGPAPGLASEVARVGSFPARHFDQRERKVLQSVKTYVDAIPPIGPGTILLANLATGITPSHVVKFAGKYTTTGGSATEAQTVTGVLSTDIVIACLQAHSSTQTLILSVPTTNTITYTFSADPSSSTIVSYQVLRAAS